MLRNGRGITVIDARRTKDVAITRSGKKVHRFVAVWLGGIDGINRCGARWNKEMVAPTPECCGMTVDVIRRHLAAMTEDPAETGWVVRCKHGMSAIGGNVPKN